jgi:hypothetical protein
LLTFESNDNLEKLSKGYCELVISDFFSSFSHDYNAIFISEFDPTKNPLNKEIKFFIKFDDVNKAKKFLNNSSYINE